MSYRFVPVAKCFNSMLWGAITAYVTEQHYQKWSKKKRPGQLFFVVSIRQALAWVRLLISGPIATPERKLSIQRWTDVSTRSATMRIALRTDASPYGFGPVLFVKGVPMVWLAGDWENKDFNLFGAESGDPAWQSEWELHAALLAIGTWLLRLRGQPLCLFQSDSTATLYAVMHASGKTPSYALAAEIALRLECANVFTVPEHVAGTLNFDCDALSRLSEGAQCQRSWAMCGAMYQCHGSLASFGRWPATLLIGRQRQSSARGPGASGKRVRTASQSLARQKRTAALKDKLKGKGKGDQAQQAGAHAVPVDRGQEDQLIWKLRGATTASAFSQLSCSIGSLFCCSIREFHMHFGLRVLLWQSPHLLQAATTTAWVTNKQRKDLPDMR